jgi:hypothetical protein
MYAAMNERRALDAAAEGSDSKPTADRSSAPMRRMVTFGIAAALLVVSAVNVGTLSQWVTEHLPGVGQTSGHHRSGNDDPGRTADLHAPGSRDKNDGDQGDGGQDSGQNGGGKQSTPSH